MPTYEYACKACHHEWAVEQRITENAITVCPKCHKAKAERQISGGNFILKGGGWYADLYSSPSKSKSTSETETKPETKPADAKPAAATETKTKSEPAPAKTPTTPKA